MKQNKDISNRENTTKEQFQASVKAYARWFGVGFLSGVAFSIWFQIHGISTAFVLAILFGALGYQLKMKSYERKK